MLVIAAGLAAGLLLIGADREMPRGQTTSEASVPSPATSRLDPLPPPEAGKARIILVGDVLPLEDRDYLGSVAPLLRSADLTIGNLEAPLSTRGERLALKLDDRGRTRSGQFLFRAPPAQAIRLADAGFDVLTLANNHIMDYGPEALHETTEVLDQAGIRHTGAGADLTDARRPAIVEAAGQTIAVRAYVCAGTLPGIEGFAATADSAGAAFVHGDGAGEPTEQTREMLQEDIGRAQAEADFVIVSFHWGTESRFRPDPLPRALARYAIDSGANMIVGHHPHVLQGIEIYRGAPICYSLGNFVFPTPWEINHDSAVFELVLREGAWRRIVLHPVKLRNPAGDPEAATGADLRRIVGLFTSLSEEMGTRCEVRDEGGHTQVVIANPAPPEPREHLLKAEERFFAIEPHPKLAGMSVVHFLAWDFAGEQKLPHSREVVVSSALAQEVLAIFREIYLAPERFPIHEVIGHDYRTVTGGEALSWHALGRAIDINRAQNPMIVDGEAVVHSEEPPYEPDEWRPGEDPYSITPDGSVVRAFKSRGWRWGGDWTSVKDYQHFDRPG